MLPAPVSYSQISKKTVTVLRYLAVLLVLYCLRWCALLRPLGYLTICPLSPPAEIYTLHTEDDRKIMCIL